MKIALGIIGATGRIGKLLLSSALEDPAFCIAGGVAQKNSESIGQDLGSLISRPTIGAILHPQVETALENADIGIDFSSPSLLVEILDAALHLKKPLVLGTTGYSEKEREKIKEASQEIPILYSPNFSFGIALCLETVAFLAKNLYGDAYIDIVETHHIHKKDAPSGSALALAKAIGNGKIINNPSHSPRSKEEIVIHAIRFGETIGEHVVIFEWGEERIEIKHQAHSREAFAKGALKAAKFLIQKQPGLYSVKDLFSTVLYQI